MCYLLTGLDVTKKNHALNSQGYKPGGGNIYYLSAVCEPGDDQGHNQNTEARVSCVFEKAETNQIVEKLGVQLV